LTLQHILVIILPELTIGRLHSHALILDIVWTFYMYSIQL